MQVGLVEFWKVLVGAQSWFLPPCQNALSSLFQEMPGFAHASNSIGINWFVKFYRLPMFVRSSYLLIRETPKFGR